MEPLRFIEHDAGNFEIRVRLADNDDADLSIVIGVKPTPAGWRAYYVTAAGGPYDVPQAPWNPSTPAFSYDAAYAYARAFAYGWLTAKAGGK